MPLLAQTRTPSGVREIGRALVFGSVFALLAGASAAAQPVDAEIDPFPFDPRLALREFFRTRLPPLWYASEPETSLTVYSVDVHIPDGWRGNPTGAVMNLCPGRDDPLWNGLQLFEMIPVYEDRRWPGFTCRR